MTNSPIFTKTKITVPSKNNPLLTKAIQLINQNIELQTMWNMNNIIAITRMGMTDHGPTHMNIVANIGIQLTRLLHKKDIQMSVEKDYGLSFNHAELIVFLGCLFHDLGMTVNRDGHEEFSIAISFPMLREILTFLEEEERTIVIGETLHAIINHRKIGTPLTIEGGILAIADALDMSQGRSRIPFEAGKVDIHSVSAHAIDHVELKEGKDTPVEVHIKMNNSAGIFQVDQLLKKKLNASNIKHLFKIKAIIDRKKEEKKIIETFEL